MIKQYEKIKFIIRNKYCNKGKFKNYLKILLINFKIIIKKYLIDVLNWKFRKNRYIYEYSLAYSNEVKIWILNYWNKCAIVLHLFYWI